MVYLSRMPKSKLRKKVEESRAHTQDVVAHAPHEPLESPKWLAPTMVAGFLIGLFWIVTYYVTQTNYPIPGIGAWNMIIGFSFIGVGFSLATRWR
jgi:predicted secreted protein